MNLRCSTFIRLRRPYCKKCQDVVPLIVVHGGAGEIPEKRIPGKLKGIKTAVKAAMDVLKGEGSAVEATEAAVRVMEDDGAFNAGYGSVLTIEGNVEMSASIMQGDALRAGAVGYLKNFANPISIARRVMLKSSHVLLVGDGATRFAEKEGFVMLPDGSLVTKKAKLSLERFKKYAENRVDIKRKVKFVDREGGTVGAVALDRLGNVAAATSTGGISGKHRGRVGDSPQLGCGTYADNKMGAVSATGHGESILKACLAHTILMRMHLSEGKLCPQEATRIAIGMMTERVKNTAGAIAINPSGEIGIYHTTKRMVWAYSVVGENVMKFGIEHGRCEEEPIG